MFECVSYLTTVSYRPARVLSAHTFVELGPGRGSQFITLFLREPPANKVVSSSHRWQNVRWRERCWVQSPAMNKAPCKCISFLSRFARFAALNAYLNASDKTSSTASCADRSQKSDRVAIRDIGASTVNLSEKAPLTSGQLSHPPGRKSGYKVVFFKFGAHTFCP